ncbi:anhydro-N-acetylmuramic acid kinase [Undibacterium cyanobacteriorum]|uniref:Anhydro-N-acetylmuramic acid kinase n=1 Tax=Undibacterium cyanobacteriorum TaxID=3073561 RepID=A0ABY9RIL7_9BURK|nr:anhydro-N-acetylmuramic acid kinase [Undibacterium sp. 20NA77.5]WMW80172.1 anhydro-N-acetylmuramic acid kinase [Undibacterium sp. 20NA77.5]
MNTLQQSNLYIGLMSGTSLDGVDGVLVDLPRATEPMRILATAHIPFDAALREQGMALQQSGYDEIHREALFANEVVEQYAHCVQRLLELAAAAIKASDLEPTKSLIPEHPNTLNIRAIGVHGQTIRHRPELGYTRQTNNPARLAELCGIDVIADFRSRDVAAGGQGAPLVPAFHRAIFASAQECRVVVNIGGISNISILHSDGRTFGFDTGPGNVLMDAWIARHHGKTYDANGEWARSGKVNEAFLNCLCEEAFFNLAPPKSTGRDTFHLAWLDQKLAAFEAQSPQQNSITIEDVQATLCALTAKTIAKEIMSHATECAAVFVCGGGAFNDFLMEQLAEFLQQFGQPPRSGRVIPVSSTATLGVAPDQVEALAFAWLAQCFAERQPGNVEDVTGAAGPRILGAMYPA